MCVCLFLRLETFLLLEQETNTPAIRSRWHHCRSFMASEHIASAMFQNSDWFKQTKSDNNRTGWWFWAYPSNMKVSWDYEIPNIWKLII